MLEKKKKQVQPLLMHVLKTKGCTYVNQDKRSVWRNPKFDYCGKMSTRKDCIIGAADADKKLFKLDIKYP
jgi:hypothetical protein